MSAGALSHEVDPKSMRFSKSLTALAEFGNALIPQDYILVERRRACACRG
jgi:hypothetical protein